MYNKTGLQPDSRPVEQNYHLRGWKVGAKSLDSKAVQAVTFLAFMIRYPCMRIGTQDPVAIHKRTSIQVLVKIHIFAHLSNNGLY